MQLVVEYLLNLGLLPDHEFEFKSWVIFLLKLPYQPPCTFVWFGITLQNIQNLIFKNSRNFRRIKQIIGIV